MPKDSTVLAADAKQDHEAELNQAIESELSDEQLVELAEGSSSWGAHCNSSSGCN